MDSGRVKGGVGSLGADYGPERRTSQVVVSTDTETDFFWGGGGEC